MREQRAGVSLVVEGVIAWRIDSAGVQLYAQRLGLRTVWRATRVAR